MNLKAKTLLLVVSSILAILPALTVQAFTAESEATVFVYPEKTTVKINATFQVFVNVSSVSKLQGFDFMLTYDNRLLECLDITEGTFLSGFGPTFVAKREINSSFVQNRGRVWFAAVIYGTGFADGNGSLAVITFDAVSKGETLLDLYSDFPFHQDKVKLTTCGSQAIPNKAVDGSVTVADAESGGSDDPPPTAFADPPSDSPSVDVNGDGVVNILDMSLVGVAYGTVKGSLRYDVKADLDQNGTVDVLDLALVARAYLRMM